VTSAEYLKFKQRRLLNTLYGFSCEENFEIGKALNTFLMLFGFNRWSRDCGRFTPEKEDHLSEKLKRIFVNCVRLIWELKGILTNMFYLRFSLCGYNSKKASLNLLHQKEENPTMPWYACPSSFLFPIVLRFLFISWIFITSSDCGLNSLKKAVSLSSLTSS
jgi:hypothetical protein